MAETITAQELIEKFQYALDNNWGYIWGTAGILWTQARQNDLNKTTDENRAMSRKYGSKWIGHYVADCSGLFVWAFKQYGLEMSHISSNIYKSYCATKGKLTSALKETIKPGCAVFTGDTESNHPHVGLYIGNDTVIEAKGTQAGVVTSKLSDSKWKWYGELKKVVYGDAPKPAPVPEGYAVVTGVRVALRTAPTTSAKIITRIDTGKTVKIETPPPSEWEYVSYQGKEGYMMKEFLREE